MFFEYFKFELQVDGIIQFSDSKNVIHGIWCMLSPYPRTRIKFQASDIATRSKPSQIFTTAYTCDNMTPRQVS